MFVYIYAQSAYLKCIWVILVCQISNRLPSRTESAPADATVPIIIEFRTFQTGTSVALLLPELFQRSVEFFPSLLDAAVTATPPERVQNFALYATLFYYF